MTNILKSIQDNIVPVLVTAILSFFSFLLLGIWSELLPLFLPPLQKLPINFYLKIILLLLTLLILAISLIILLFFQLKPKQPRVMHGKFQRLQWRCEITYWKDRQNNPVDPHIYFLCPVHKTSLHLQQAVGAPGVYHELYCPKCKKTYSFTEKGAMIYLEEAEKQIRHQILSTVRIPESIK